MPSVAATRNVSRPTIPTGTTEFRLETWIRRISLTVVGVLVLAGALGYLGVRSDTMAVSTDELSLIVEYPRITRPGLASPLSIEVLLAEGAPRPDEIEVRVSADYLTILDLNGIVPSPASEFGDGEWIGWTFAIPAGETRLRVDVDARLEPAVQWKRDGKLQVLIDEDLVVDTHITTWVAP